MSRKVAVVGSTSLEVSAAIGADIVDLIKDLGPGVILLTRGSGEIDRFIGAVAPLLEMPCFGYPSQGGADDWIRDVELVRDADEVIAIVSRQDLEKKAESGTLHVVEKALQQEKKTRLFTILDGSLVGVASDDGREVG